MRMNKISLCLIRLVSFKAVSYFACLFVNLAKQMSNCLINTEAGYSAAGCVVLFNPNVTKFCANEISTSSRYHLPRRESL